MQSWTAGAAVRSLQHSAERSNIKDVMLHVPVICSAAPTASRVGSKSNVRHPKRSREVPRNEFGLLRHVGNA